MHQAEKRDDFYKQSLTTLEPRSKERCRKGNPPSASHSKRSKFRFQQTRTFLIHFQVWSKEISFHMNIYATPWKFLRLKFNSTPDSWFVATIDSWLSIIIEKLMRNSWEITTFTFFNDLHISNGRVIWKCQRIGQNSMTSPSCLAEDAAVAMARC